ncbi:MAG: 30S ribosomal protein S20 [bacterium]
MPITKSAIKAMKQSRKANDRNKVVKADYKAKVKAVKKESAGDSKNLGKLASLAVQSLDKAAKNGVIHKRTAARKKSRLAKALERTTGKSIELNSIKEPVSLAKPKVSAKSKTTPKKTIKKEA